METDIRIILFASVCTGYLLGMSLITHLINKIGQKKSVDIYRIRYISKTLNMALTLICMIILSIIMGIEYSQITLFLSSVFAVIGVALFAQWSILSNITASLIIFFVFPYRVGDPVKIGDTDEDIFGLIDEITLFHVIIRRDQDIITYPNNLILQKPVVKVTSLDPLFQQLKKAREGETEKKPD